MNNTHLERTLTEILKKLEKAEREIAALKRNKSTVIDNYGSRASSISGNDHRFLENLNSENYTHLTHEEYSRLKNVTGDHGELTGLGDDDHKQYVLHKLSESNWDILAGAGNRTFARKSYAQLINKIAENIYPMQDGTSAIRISRANGMDSVVIIDTLNGRVGINVLPQSSFHTQGDVIFSNGNISFSKTDGAIKINSNANLDIQVNDEININATHIMTNAKLGSGQFSADDMGSRDGWEISQNGDASFRNVEVKEIRAKVIATSSESAVGGKQTLCKSSSTLTRDFTVPEPGHLGEVYLYVHTFSDTPETSVFDNGDILKLTNISIFNGEYNTSTCWLTVENKITSTDKEQKYSVKRITGSDKRIAGDCSAGDIISSGSLALNYGYPNSGAGIILSTVV